MRTLKEKIQAFFEELQERVEELQRWEDEFRREKEEIFQLLDEFEKRQAAADRHWQLPVLKSLQVGKLKEYIQSLHEAIYEPIRSARKQAFEELGIRITQSKEWWNDEEIDHLIEKLKTLQRKWEKEQRLYQYVTHTVERWLENDSVKRVISRVANVIQDAEVFEKCCQLKDPELQESFWGALLDQADSLEQIIDQREQYIDKVLELERRYAVCVRGLDFKEEEIDEITEKLRKIAELEKSALPEGPYQDFKEFRQAVEEACKKVEERREHLVRELSFWKKVLGEHKLSLSSIEELAEELKRTKGMIREQFPQAFKILEQYRTFCQQVEECAREIDFPKFAEQLDCVLQYCQLPSITEKNFKEVVNIVEEAYSRLKDLMEVRYPLPQEKLADKSCREVIEWAKGEYRRYQEQKKAVELYSRLLEEDLPSDYGNYKTVQRLFKKLSQRFSQQVGQDFEKIVRYIKGEVDTLEVDCEQLKKFLTQIRPLLQRELFKGRA